MKLIERVIGVTIILLLLSLHFPESAFPLQRTIYAKVNNSKTVIGHTPEFLAPPEVEMPVKLEKRGINKWVWVGLGVLAAGILAGAGGGGGGDDDGGGGDDHTGSIVISGPAP